MVFFETYLELNQREEQILEEEIKKTEPHEEVAIMEMMTSWEKRGLEKGRAEGWLEGKAEGRAEGRAEGKAEGKAEVAKTMLLRGMDEDLISELTGLSAEDVEKLRK